MLRRRLQRLESAPEDAAGVVSTRRISRVVLPGGQQARLLVPAGLAPASAVRSFASAAQKSSQRRTALVRALATRVTQNHAQLSRSGVRRLRRQLSAVLKADSGLSQQFSQLQLARQRQLAGQRAVQAERVQLAERRGIWHQAVALSSLPLCAILGRHNLQHHLTLLVSLLLWVFGDEVTDMLSSRNEAESAAANRSPWWLYVSPAANLLTGWWLLHDRQHEPFVSGMARDFQLRHVDSGLRSQGDPLRRVLGAAKAVLAPCLQGRTPGRYFEEYESVVDLSEHVAPEFTLDLLGLQEVPAVVTVASLAWNRSVERRAPRVEGVSARVELGKLYVTLRCSAERRSGRTPASLRGAEVAWLVQVLNETQLSRSL